MYVHMAKQPKLPAGMGTWLKLADCLVWAHGNTRNGGKKKRAKRSMVRRSSQLQHSLFEPLFLHGYIDFSQVAAYF